MKNFSTPQKHHEENLPAQEKKTTKEEKQKQMARQSMKMKKQKMDRQKQHLKQLYGQIRIQKEKADRLQKQQQQRYQMMHRKVLFNKDTGTNYLNQKIANQNQKEDLETPVDGQILMGSRVYMVNCSSCHALEYGTDSSQNAPSLGMIYNRKAGIDLSYKDYTKALISKQFYWTARNLYRWMEDPTSLVPGTKCGLIKQPLQSQSKRADMIMFLKSYSKELAINMNIQAIKSQGYETYQTKLYTENITRDKIYTDLSNMS